MDCSNLTAESGVKTFAHKELFSFLFQTFILANYSAYQSELMDLTSGLFFILFFLWTL